VLQITTVQLREGQPPLTCAASLRVAAQEADHSSSNCREMTVMLNVRDECDLPEDDGYDLFTRETEFERRRQDEPQYRTRRSDGDGDLPLRLFSSL